MYEILEKCSTKKTKASHPQPKKIFQAIILKNRNVQLSRWREEPSNCRKQILK